MKDWQIFNVNELLGESMLFFRKKPEKFRYTPFYYDQKKDPEEEKRKRFSLRPDQGKYRRKKSYLGVFVLLVITILLFQYLGKIRTKVPQDVELKNMEIVK